MRAKLKKLFTILGVIFLILLVLGAGGFIYLVSRGLALDKESKAFVDGAVPAIVKNWDEQELAKRASREFLASLKENDLTRLFQAFRRLGQLREYQGSQGEASMYFTARTGKQITAVYVAKAKFEAGSAAIKVTAIKHGQVADFRIPRRFRGIHTAITMSDRQDPSQIHELGK